MADTAPIPNRRPIPVRLDEVERAKLESMAATWGVSLAAAIRRLIREAKVEEKP